MKKRVKGILTGALVATMFIAGCSGIAPVTNNQSGIIYNGGAVVSVGDHLIYANGFVSGVDDFSVSSDSEYKAAQSYAYLSRTNKAEFIGDKYENENQINQLSSSVVGFSNNYMFALGNNLYYASPNLHKTSENKHVWKYISIFKSDLSGNNEKEIYTTTAYDSTKAQIKALEFEGSYYLVIFDGTNIVSINLSNDNAHIVSEKATSVALPDENESWDGYIYYTESRLSDVGQKGNIVYKSNIKEMSSSIICQENDLTIKFTGRVENTLFYSRTNEVNGVTETYSHNTENQTLSFKTAGKRFYSLEISNVESVAENNTLYKGYTFDVVVSSKTQVMYYNIYTANNTQAYQPEILLTGDSGFADMIVNYGLDYYYITAESIEKIDLSSKQTQTIVSGFTFTPGVYGYDFAYVDGEISRLDNIYFFSQIPELENEDESSEGTEKDENYYLYGVEASGVSDPFLVGKKA